MKSESLHDFVLGLTLDGPEFKDYPEDYIRRSRLLLRAFVNVYGYPVNEYHQPGRGYLAYLKEARKSPLVIRLDVADAYGSVPLAGLQNLFGSKFLDVFQHDEDRDAFIKDWCCSTPGTGLIKGLAHSGWVFSQCMKYTLDTSLTRDVRKVFDAHKAELPKLWYTSYHRYADEVTLGLHLEGSKSLSVARMKEVGRFVVEKLKAHEYQDWFCWQEAKTRVGCPQREPVRYSDCLGIGPSGVMLANQWLEDVYRKTHRLLTYGYSVEFWRDDPFLATESMLAVVPYRPLRSLTGKLSAHDPLRRDIWKLQGSHDLIRQVYAKQRHSNRALRRLKPLMEEFRAIRKRIT